MSAIARDIKLEVAVFSGRNALKAQQQNAHRVELSAPGTYLSGGLTPPLSELEGLKGELKIPLRIMIRPVSLPNPQEPWRTDDFVYTGDELIQMRDDIIEFKNSGAMNLLRGDGFVFGLLKERQNSETGANGADIEQGARLVVDKEQCEVLIEAARPYPCVFHRAFDPIAKTDEHWKQGLDDLIACKFDGLLTSGGPAPYTDSRKLHEIIDYARPDLQIVVGGGVRATNTTKLITDLGAHCTENIWLHSSCLASRPDEPQEEDIDPDLLRDLLVVINELRGP